MSNDRPDDLVGVTEAAAAVGVNKSTVSRYVSQGLLTDYGVPGRPLVSVSQVRSVRAAALDPAKRRTPAPSPADADPAEPAPRPGLPTTSAPSVETTLANERIRKTRADADRADRAELENAKSQGQLVERDAAANAGFDLGPALMRLLDERAPGLATRLVGVADYRTALSAIQDADRKMLEKWKHKIETTLADAGLTRTDDKPE